MKKILMVIGVIFALVLAFSIMNTLDLPRSGAIERSYTNPQTGISFTYPEGYVLDEFSRDDDGEAYTLITLTREENAVVPENGEGPAGISIALYPVADAQQSIGQWVRSSAASNFALSNGGTGSSSVDGADAVTYHWSGLYEGDTTAFLHAGNAVLVSVTYIAPEDPQRDAYAQVVKSLKLE